MYKITLDSVYGKVDYKEVLYIRMDKIKIIIDQLIQPCKIILEI
jgi:hypothetical protein